MCLNKMLNIKFLEEVFSKIEEHQTEQLLVNKL